MMVGPKDEKKGLRASPDTSFLFTPALPQVLFLYGDPKLGQCVTPYRKASSVFLLTSYNLGNGSLVQESM